MNTCDYCNEVNPDADCTQCLLGNPCLSCDDYDKDNDSCKSAGGCAKLDELV